LSAVLELLDRACDFGDDQWSEPFGRLIEQKNPRVADQRTTDSEHLLLSARQQAGKLTISFRQARK
jgi:hypothetical protein